MMRKTLKMVCRQRDSFSSTFSMVKCERLLKPLKKYSEERILLNFFKVKSQTGKNMPFYFAKPTLNVCGNWRDMKKAVFLDRDGTINSDEHGYINKPDDLQLYPFAAEAIYR